MKSHDSHSVRVDVKEDGSDVWEATWKNDGFVRVYHGDSQNNRILMQHLITVDFEVDSTASVGVQINYFVEFAGALLFDMISANA
jgi:hypothetical protein